MSIAVTMPIRSAPAESATVTHIHVEARAVSLDTAAAMFEWSPGRFDKWRRKWGVAYAPGSNRFLVADIDAAIDKWRRAGSPSDSQGADDDEEDPFERALREHARD